jgi:protein tyrosine phosphatase (PTP) superfamily phosphohydrolase (DUF442 family)
MPFLRSMSSSFFRRRFRVYWLTDDVAVSKEPAAGDWPSIGEQGIRCVVDLRSETPDDESLVRSHGLHYMRVPVDEGSAPTDQELELVTDWILERIEADGPVLVHCREGRGRSPLVACAALVKLGIPPFEAYKLLQRARPDIALNADQAAMLQRFALAHGGLNPDEAGGELT